MTTETSVPTEQRGNYKILERGENEKGWTLKLDLPWTEYPDAITVPSEHQLAAQLRVGTVWAFVLKRGGLHKDKEGNKKPGTSARDYYWNFGAVAPPQVHASSGAAPNPTPTPGAAESVKRPARPPVADSQAASIERQVAAKNRTELAIHCLQQAVVFHDGRIPVDAKAISWADIIQAARLAYDEFRAETLVQLQDTEPQPSEPDDQEFE